jgi:excisionase family DNA binding protein
MSEQTRTASVNPAALLTQDEARELLRIGRTTFYWLVKRGELDVVEIAGRRMVEPATLEAFIAANRRSAREVVSGP